MSDVMLHAREGVAFLQSLSPELKEEIMTTWRRIAPMLADSSGDFDSELQQFMCKFNLTDEADIETQPQNLQV